MIRIWDTDGNELNVSDYGLKGLRLIIPSPSYSVTQETIPGRAGVITLGKDLQPRPMTAEFLVTGVDYDDSILLRDELYSLFSKGNTFYIGEKRQMGKRWLVECTEQWTPERVNYSTMTTNIPLLAPSGKAESTQTTTNMIVANFTGLGAREQKYTHTSTSFEILNNGEKVDPRFMYLAITYKGASTNLSIKNLTTNEEWSYTGTSSTGDTITLDGIRSTKNGLSVFRDTNKKLLTLAPGWNEFLLSGTSGSFEITFDFRFHTL